MSNSLKKPGLLASLVRVLQACISEYIDEFLRVILLQLTSYVSLYVTASEVTYLFILGFPYLTVVSTLILT